MPRPAPLLVAALLLLAASCRPAAAQSAGNPTPPECVGKAASSGAFSQLLLPCTSEKTTTCSKECRSALEQLGYGCVLAGSIRLSPSTPIATVTSQVFLGGGTRASSLHFQWAAGQPCTCMLAAVLWLLLSWW